MARNREREISELMPKKDANIKDWQYFRSIMEFERILNRDISISDIAAKIDVKHFTVRNYIYGPNSERKSVPPIYVMEGLYEHFGYNVLYVITGEMETKSEKDLRVLVDKYREDSEDKDKEILKLKGTIEYLEEKLREKEKDD